MRLGGFDETGAVPPESHWIAPRRRGPFRQALLARSSGILLHPTSLPGGRLGPQAFRFVDWLARAGQSWWQMLPIGPPDSAGSPYASSSAFAAWTGLLAEPGAPVSPPEIESFAVRHAYWLDDWASFAGADAIAGQARFGREWEALRAYAAKRGVGLIGDLPIYVARNGVDHTAHPQLFQTNEVSGAPPDALGPEGQLWGNALYDWTAHRAEGYRWWIERFRRTFELFDLARIDHFRGFVAYWAVPSGSRTARNGRWRRGPGAELFRAAAAKLGKLPLIAEDLGVITPAVHRLREALGFPGMHVMQWAFGGSRQNVHRIENHRTLGVACTGTHDTETALGWWRSLSIGERERTGLDPATPHWSLIARAFSSRARLAIVPLQDVLGLGSEARMNRPGKTAGNWSWQLEEGELEERHAEQLRRLTVKSRRVP